MLFLIELSILRLTNYLKHSCHEYIMRTLDNIDIKFGFVLIKYQLDVYNHLQMVKNKVVTKSKSATIFL